MRRKKKVRLSLKVRRPPAGGADLPRLSIFRSNRYIYAQLIDDKSGKTLVSASSLELKNKKKVSKREGAEYVGKTITERAKSIGIKKAVFDRGSYRYHGRVKLLAETARRQGFII